MRDEVTRVAPLWNPDLDDGVVLVMAPLWRLVPQHKPWQKELKTHWDELCAGKYDWAHLAMHLWPERVVPKCAEDRSLAIAHGLEDVFWDRGRRRQVDSRARSPPLESTSSSPSAPPPPSRLRWRACSAHRAIRWDAVREGRCVNPLHEYLVRAARREARQSDASSSSTTRGRSSRRSSIASSQNVGAGPDGLYVASSSASGRRSSRATTARSSRCALRSSRSSRRTRPSRS